MNKTVKTNGKRMTALMLVLVLVVSMFSTTAFAAQEDNYHDPAEHWLNAANRTNELDANIESVCRAFRQSCGDHESHTAGQYGLLYGRSQLLWRTMTLTSCVSLEDQYSTKAVP